MPPNINKIDDSWMYTLLKNKTDTGWGYLQNQGELLKLQAQLPPQMQVFDGAQTSKEAAEWGIENKIRSRDFEGLTDPNAARMRHEMGSRVAELTDITATKKGMDDWAKKQGITSGYTTGLGQSTIGNSAIYDVGTAAGRMAKLRNLQIQQGYLAQTPAPIGGLDPASIIQAEMAAKKQNLESMQQYQQNILAGGQAFQQSATDWINQNLGELQKASNVEQQNKQSREQFAYENAVQKAASENSKRASYIQTGGAVVGAALGAAIII
jgi:hypothetical protein